MTAGENFTHFLPVIFVEMVQGTEQSHHKAAAVTQSVHHQVSSKSSRDGNVGLSVGPPLWSTLKYLKLLDGLP